jgi:CHASE3 domain sensor protein/putative methionine-R-sulfoxide reductase with GAF domain
VAAHIKSPAEWSLAAKISTAFWLAMVLLFLARLQSLQSLLKLTDTSTLLARNAEVMSLLDETVALVANVESAEFAFVLTGDPAGMTNRPRDEVIVRSKLGFLRDAVSDVREQMTRFTAFEAVVTNRLALGRQLLELRQQQGLEPAQRMVQSGALQLATGNLRQIVGDLKREEDDLLRTRRNEVQGRFQHRMLAFSFFTAFEFLLLTLAYYLVSLYTRERTRREKSLYEDGQLRAAVIATQYDIAAIQPDLERVMKLIVQRTQDLTRAEGALMEIVDGDDLVVRAASGGAASFGGRRLPRVESLSGLSVDTDEILVCDDTAKDARKDRDVFRKAGFRSMIVVPLHHEGERIGVLRLVSKQPSTFGEKEIQTMVLMSGFLSAAVVNATRLAHDRIRDQASGMPDDPASGPQACV